MLPPMQEHVYQAELLLLYMYISNGCFFGSAVLAWSKYATVHYVQHNPQEGAYLKQIMH
jgi:hypothetical protein